MALSMLSVIGKNYALNYNGKIYQPNSYFFFLNNWADEELKNVMVDLLRNSTYIRILDREVWGTSTILRTLQESTCAAVVTQENGDNPYFLSQSMSDVLRMLYDSSQEKDAFFIKFHEQNFQLYRPYFSMVAFTDRLNFEEKMLLLTGKTKLKLTTAFIVVRENKKNTDTVKKIDWYPQTLRPVLINRLRNISRIRVELKISKWTEKLVSKYIKGLNEKLSHNKGGNGVLFYQQAPTLFLKLLMLNTMDMNQRTIGDIHFDLTVQAFEVIEKNVMEHLEVLCFEEFSSFDILQFIKAKAPVTYFQLCSFLKVKDSDAQLALCLSRLQDMKEIRTVDDKGTLYLVPYYMVYPNPH